MKPLHAALLAAIVVTSLANPLQADDKDPNAVLNKAIKAVGGEENLKKAQAISWKAKGTMTFNGNDNAITIHAIALGIDHFRSEFEGEFNGDTIKGVIVMNVDKGWRKFRDESTEMDENALANEKRRVYLDIIPTLLVPLKEKGFKIEAAGEEKVDDKPALGLKVAPPDGKEFTLFFDKESGLPVKMVAKVVGFQGEDYTQTTTYKNYKDFDGIKKATKIESKRDGEDFIKQEISEFKVLDKTGPKTFSEPE